MPELIKTFEVILQAAVGLAFDLLVRSKKHLVAITIVACGHFVYVLVGHYLALPIKTDHTAAITRTLEDKVASLSIEFEKQRAHASKDTAKSFQEGFQKGFDTGFDKARLDASREHYRAGETAGRQAMEQEFQSREKRLKDAIQVAQEEAEQLMRTNKRLANTITDHEYRSATMAQILNSLEKQLKAALSNDRQSPTGNRSPTRIEYDTPIRTYGEAPAPRVPQEQDTATRRIEEEKFQMDRKALLYMIYKK